MSLKLTAIVSYICRLRTRIYSRLTPTQTKLEQKSELVRPAKMVTDEKNQLLNERVALEKEISELVEKLETYKKPGEPKLEKDQIIRSQEEKDFLAKLAKLELSKPTLHQPANPQKDASKNTPKPQKDAAQPTRAKNQPAVDKPIDISRLDFRIGKILECNQHPESEKLYISKIECGDENPRTVLSGLVKFVPVEEMRGRKVLLLCNLKPAKMAGVVSEGMVICASNEVTVEVLNVPDSAKPGDKVSMEAYPGEPDAQLNPKKKVWEQVSVDFKTNDEGIATYKSEPIRVPGVDGFFKSNIKNVHLK